MYVRDGKRGWTAEREGKKDVVVDEEAVEPGVEGAEEVERLVNDFFGTSRRPAGREG